MSEVGTVTRVRIDENTKRVHVDVQISPSREHEDIKFRTPAKNMWILPELGDTVEVTDVGEKNYVAHSPMSVPGAGPPAGLERGDIAIRLDDDTQLLLSKSGAGYDVSLEASGDLHLDGTNVTIGENGKRVLTEDAVFEYEQRVDTDDGTGGTTTQTTTTVSNGETTNTEVE